MNDAKNITADEKEVLRALNRLYLPDHGFVVDDVKDIVIKAINTKQDEIERYKSQWQNAEDANIKLLENIESHKKEIERLKEENGILSRKADGANKLCSEKHDFMLSQFKKKDERIEHLTASLAKCREALNYLYHDRINNLGEKVSDKCSPEAERRVIEALPEETGGEK